MCGNAHSDCGCSTAEQSARFGGVSPAAAGPAPLRFMTPHVAAGPEKAVVAAGYGVPAYLPGSLVTMQGSWALYEDLGYAVGPDGQPRAARYPGTWARHFAAGKAR